MASTLEFVAALRVVLQPYFGNRIYPKVLPDNVAFPAMTYIRISDIRDRTHSGASGLATQRWQLSAWGRNYDDLVDLMDQVRPNVNAVRASWGGIDVVAFHDDESEDREEETGLERVDMDILVSYDAS